MNSYTKIDYHLPGSGSMKLWISDVQGKELMEVENGVKGGGNYTVQIPIQSLAPGVYLYHLLFEGRLISRRLSVY